MKRAMEFMVTTLLIFFGLLLAILALGSLGCAAPRCPVNNGGFEFDDRFSEQDIENLCPQFQHVFAVGSETYPLPRAPYGWRIAVGLRPWPAADSSGIDWEYVYPDAALIAISYNPTIDAIARPCRTGLIHAMAHSHRNSSGIPWEAEQKHYGWESVTPVVSALQTECERLKSVAGWSTL